MTESNAFLAYGIMGTTESLLYAVAAWPKLQGPFAFLDMVQLRRNKGTLRATQSRRDLRSVFERVPSEVWDVVRHKLVGIELRKAEIAHVESLMCPRCHAGLRVENLTWEDWIEECEDSGAQHWRNFSGFAENPRLQVARNMLARFGLAIPTPLPILFSSGYDLPFVDPEADPRTATMFSLPPPSAGGDDAFDEQVIVDVSLKVPPDATARFRRLVSQLHLQLVDLTDGILANECSKKVQGKTKLRYDERKCKEVPLAKIKPGWKLINMAKTTW